MPDTFSLDLFDRSLLANIHLFQLFFPPQPPISSLHDALDLLTQKANS